MKTFLASLLLAVATMLAACGPAGTAALPAPQEPSDQSVAYFCHMNLTEHEGPRGQAFLRGQDKPYWFASPGEAFTFLQTEVMSGELLALYVNDMGQGSWEQPAPGAWVEIHKASFVLESSRTAAMGGPEAVPFADKSAAEAFAKQYGGHVVNFEDAAKALAVDTPGGSHDS